MVLVGTLVTPAAPSTAKLAKSEPSIGADHAGPAPKNTPTTANARIGKDFNALALRVLRVPSDTIFMLASSFGQTMLLIGIAGLGAALLFHLVTLPVEFDASRRALLILEKDGYLTREENAGARSVLTAAAMTYVVAALGALATLAYYMGFLRRDED